MQKNDKTSDWQIGCYTSLKLHLHVIKAKKNPSYLKHFLHAITILCWRLKVLKTLAVRPQSSLRLVHLASPVCLQTQWQTYYNHAVNKGGFPTADQINSITRSLNFPIKPDQVRLKSVYTTASQPLVDYSLIISTYTGDLHKLNQLDLCSSAPRFSTDQIE